MGCQFGREVSCGRSGRPKRVGLLTGSRSGSGCGNPILLDWGKMAKQGVGSEVGQGKSR